MEEYSLVDTDSLWNKINKKIGKKDDEMDGFLPVDESIINLPVGHGETEIGDIYREILDPKNIFQTAHIDGVERALVVMGDAYSRKRPSGEIHGFFNVILMNMMETSVARDGIRSEMLQNIAVGQLHQSYQLQLARARSGNSGLSDQQLKDVF